MHRYTTARFGAYSSGEVLTEEEAKLLTGSVGFFFRSMSTLKLIVSDGYFLFADYVYHTLAAKASGELCLKYIFSFGAFARMPLLQRFDEYLF